MPSHHEGKGDSEGSSSFRLPSRKILDLACFKCPKSKMSITAIDHSSCSSGSVAAAAEIPASVQPGKLQVK